jgi:tRNA1(Val) A37 N6-methylase TrmN6
VLGGTGQQIASILSSLPEFHSFEKMLDLGGGHGLFALYIAQANADLQALIFDRPAVVDVAEEFIDTYAMGDQVTVMAVDYMTDNIGKEYDLVRVSATFSRIQNNLDDLIKKIKKALKPNGYFISFHHNGAKIGSECLTKHPD